MSAALCLPCPTIVLVALLGAIASCADSSAPQPAPGAASARPGTPNVLIFTLDTTRADRLGCYGYANAHTPNLDLLARAGSRFTHAYAPVPLTLPSHATLFTGLHPPEHGIHDNSRFALASAVPTLAEVFRTRGYRTAAFVSTNVLDSAFGLDRGFDAYDDQVSLPTAGKAGPPERRADETGRRAIEWLRGQRGSPFLCWVHFYDPHSTYEPPPPFDKLLPTGYQGEIAFMDQEIGHVLAALDPGTLERTIIVAVADHGESLGEHGESTHGLFIYDATMHIPLIVRVPGRAPRVVDAPVQMADLAPTLCELAGFAGALAASGASLVPLIDGGAPTERSLYAECDYGWINFGWSPLRSIRRGAWKWIESSRPELYETNRDPREAQDVALSETQRAEVLSDALAELRGGMKRRAADPAKVDTELARSLAALGYLDTGRANKDDATLAGLPTPLERIGVWDKFSRAVGYLQHGQAAKAIPLFDAAVKDAPDSPAFHMYAGRAHHMLGHLAEAEAALTKSIELDPGVEEAHRELATVLEELSRYEEALVAVNRAIALQPGQHLVLISKARILVRMNREPEAVDTLREFLRLEPANAAQRWSLAKLLRGMQRHVEAVAELETLVSAAPNERGLATWLAWELATNPDDRARNGARALVLAERLVAAANGRTSEHLDVLAAAQAELGRFDDARRTQDEALLKAPVNVEAALIAEWRARAALYGERKAFRDQ